MNPIIEFRNKSLHDTQVCGVCHIDCPLLRLDRHIVAVMSGFLATDA